MPGTLRRELALTARTGRPPRWVTKSSCRCSRRPPDRTSCSQLLVHPLPAGAQLDAQLAELRRGGVPQIGAVVLDRPLDRLRERCERRVDRGGELAQERRNLLGVVERGTRAESPADRVGHVSQRPRREHAAKRRVRGGVTDVVQAFERRFARRVEQRDRLGCQCLAPSDLAGIGGRRERARELCAVGTGGRVREPLRDRRKLECHERIGIHATSVGRRASNEFADMSVATHKNWNWG